MTEAQSVSSRIREIRRTIFDVADEEATKMSAELESLKSRLRELEPAPAPVRGPWSGLTRGELAATGTCEPDWY